MEAAYDDVLDVILSLLPYPSSVHARLVCRRWLVLLSRHDEKLPPGVFNQFSRYRPNFPLWLVEEAQYHTPDFSRQWKTSMEWNPSVTLSMRRVLVLWLMEVVVKFRGCTDSLFKTVQLVDDHLAKSGTVRRNTFQTLGVASLFWCYRSPLGERKPLTDLAYITAGSSSVEGIQKWIQHLEERAEALVNTPRTCNFIYPLALAGELYDNESWPVAMYFAHVSLLNAKAVQTKPSVVAAACVGLARIAQEPPLPFWSERLACVARCQESEAREAADHMRGTLRLCREVPHKYRAWSLGEQPTEQEVLQRLERAGYM